MPSTHDTNSYVVLPTTLAFVHATSDKYRVLNQTLRTLHEYLTYIYHEKLWRVHNAKDDNQSNKFSYDNDGLWKENLNSYGQQANKNLSSVINEHIHTHTKQKTTPTSFPIK